MEVRATLRHLRVTPSKGRLVANLVRGRDCDDALAVLRACPKGVARPIAKLIRSALANAQEKNARDRAGIDLDALYVKRISVDDGPRMWRIRPRAHGRATWINKAMSHVTVVLDQR
jgi:large subunit ribosomal protein L22